MTIELAMVELAAVGFVIVGLTMVGFVTIGDWVSQIVLAEGLELERLELGRL